MADWNSVDIDLEFYFKLLVSVDICIIINYIFG